MSGETSRSLDIRYSLRRTSDVGEAEAGGAQLLSEYRLRVRLEPRFNARVNGSSVRSVDLYYLDFGRTNIDVASAAIARRYGIVIPLDGAMLLRHRGREVQVVRGSTRVYRSTPDWWRRGESNP